MIETNEAYRQAIVDEKQHHIKGSIVLPNGDVIDFSSDDAANTIVGTPSYSRQCTKNADVFGVGNIYVGTAKVTVDVPGVRRDDLKGGTLSLEFCLGDTAEMREQTQLHLGTWTITDPRRDSSGTITITAEDCMGKLNVPISNSFVGAIRIEARMDEVTRLTGVEFAQTAEEIYALIGGRNKYYGSVFCANCRDEITAIAQLIGGFACDDRYGRIVFRRFGKVPVKTIGGGERHSINLGEYTFAVRGIANVHDMTGRISVVPVPPYAEDAPEPNTGVSIPYVSTPYVDPYYDDVTDIDRFAADIYAPAARNLSLPVWTPGTVNYYGDPALELGDMVRLTGGITDDGQERDTLFLITAETWNFRGVHTLISAGAVDAGSGGTSGNTVQTAPAVSQSQQQIITLNVTKSLNAVPLKAYVGELSEELRVVAAAGFSAREFVNAFVTVTAIFSGDSHITLNVLFDGIRQTVQGIETAHSGDTVTISMTVDIQAAAGIHTVTAEACGNGELLKLTAMIWGQGIVAEQPDFTSASDYEYTTSNGKSTITKYIGESRKPFIPDTLGRAPVKVIAAGAFTGSDVEYVYIPDGVERIE